MSANTNEPMLDVSVHISAPGPVVLKAFFEPAALGAWWQVAHSVIFSSVLCASWHSTQVFFEPTCVNFDS